MHIAVAREILPPICPHWGRAGQACCRVSSWSGFLPDVHSPWPLASDIGRLRLYRGGVRISVLNMIEANQSRAVHVHIQWYEQYSLDRIVFHPHYHLGQSAMTTS